MRAQQTAVDSHQRPERGARIRMHARDQFHAFAIKIPGARGLEFEQAAQFRA